VRRRPEPRAPTARDKERDPYDLHRFAATPFDGVLRGLSDLEQRLVADARSGLNEPLAERLHAEIRAIRGT
jgi:hypothetical protein